jgi:tetratricopeptide (TPR) repeat protein
VKKIALTLTIILVVFIGIRILLQTKYHDNLTFQNLFARFFSYSEGQVLKAANSLSANSSSKSKEEAIRLYRDAVARDAQNPMRWIELGNALKGANRIDEAKKCYQRAAELGPNDSSTILRVMVFHHDLKQKSKVLIYGRHMLEIDPSVMQSIFGVYREPIYDLQEILLHGMPLRRDITQTYLRFLFLFDKPKAEGCWNWIREHSFVDNKLAGEYVSFLIQAKEPRKASDVWSKWVGRSNDSNLLLNSGFESEFRPSIFDWQLSTIPGVSAARDNSISHSGRWALHLIFDGTENPEYRHAAQSVFLEAGQYRLSGFIRTLAITSDQGIGIRLGPFRTDTVLGSSDWIELSQIIEVKEASLMRLEIFRTASWKFANKISGSAWIDDLTLKPLTNAN